MRVAVAMEIGELISVCNTARRFKQNQDLDFQENRVGKGYTVFKSVNVFPDLKCIISKNNVI